jgi:hypothetical protein
MLAARFHSVKERSAHDFGKAQCPTDGKCQEFPTSSSSNVRFARSWLRCFPRRLSLTAAIGHHVQIASRFPRCAGPTVPHSASLVLRPTHLCLWSQLTLVLFACLVLTSPHLPDEVVSCEGFKPPANEFGRNFL